MKTVIISAFIMLFSTAAFAQEFEEFESKEGDTTYIMKKYFVAFLKAGPNTDQSLYEANKIQMEHMNHLNELAEAGKIIISGPMGDEGELRGIVIFNVPTQEEAEKLAAEDPAVKAGRLIMEIHPWWAAKGSKLI